MKAWVLFSFLLISVTANSYDGSRVSDVWQVVRTGEYTELPHRKVTFGSFYEWGVNKLKAAALRTITVQDDILPPFTKLLHANGVCLKGKWIIDRENPYSGYFRQGSDGVIIARSSVALSATTKGNYRAFGMAGKIYPTTNFDHEELLRPANFFVIDDLAGTLAPQYTQTEMTNEPNVSVRVGDVFLAPIALAASKAFGAADKNPGIRQLYEISELGEEDTSISKTPTWMKISASPTTPNIDLLDFRTELAGQIYAYGKVEFDIAVADDTNFLGDKNWQEIGKIIFDEAIISEGCDFQLHFHHPPFRSK